MRKISLVIYGLVGSLIILAFGISFVPSVNAVTSTVTVTGWLTPDSAHFANSLLIQFFPLAGLVMVTTVARAFKVRGDMGVYLGLGGFVAGALFADLPTGTVNPLAIPFAFIFVGALLMFLWWWNS